MSLKSDKLSQRLKATQKFVADRTNQDVAYTEILQTLHQLESALKTGKLSVQIISRDEKLIQSLQNLLETQHFLRQSYQFTTGILTEIADPNVLLPAPSLTLQVLEPGSSPPTHYELSALHAQSIGRHPHCQIRFTNDLTLISGRHAKLQPVPDAQSSGETQWQLCDTDSTNGTYINGNRLYGCQNLGNGDQICFGSPSLNSKSAALIFECQTRQLPPTLETDAAYRQLLTGTIVYLVIDPAAPLAIAEKHFIAQASKASLHKLTVIAAMPGGTVSALIKTNLADLETWINSQPHRAMLEVLPLLLSPFAAQPGATMLMPHAQIDFEHLCNSLEALAKSDQEDVLIQSVAARFETQIQAIEMILRKQEAVLMASNGQEEEQAKALLPSSLKEQGRKVLAKVSTEKDLVFRQIRTEINQSKAKLLDDLRESSLPYKIQKFLEELEFTEARQKDYCYIRLKVGNALDSDADISVVHLAVMQLLSTELKQWTTNEWRQICNLYSEGGISRLLGKSHAALSAISCLSLPEFLLHNSQGLNVEPILQTSVVQPFFETRYKHTTIGGYLFKNVRMQAMQWVSLFTMLATSIMLLLPGQPSSQSGQLRGYILLAVLPVIVPFLFLSYNQERKEKSREAFERLQKELISHYQSIVKSLADKLVQYLINITDAEERQFRETLEAVSDQYQNQIAELEKNQLQLKIQLEESKKIQQKNVANVSKDLAEFQKLKQEPALSNR